MSGNLIFVNVEIVCTSSFVLFSSSCCYFCTMFSKDVGDTCRISKQKQRKNSWMGVQYLCIGILNYFYLFPHSGLVTWSLVKISDLFKLNKIKGHFALSPYKTSQWFQTINRLFIYLSDRTPWLQRDGTIQHQVVVNPSECSTEICTDIAGDTLFGRYTQTQQPAELWCLTFNIRCTEAEQHEIQNASFWVQDLKWLMVPID